MTWRTLSIYTARISISHSFVASRPQNDAESKLLLPVSQLAKTFLELIHPLCSLSLQEIHHYYRMIRPLHMHWYFPPSRVTLIRFSLNIT